MMLDVLKSNIDVIQDSCLSIDPSLYNELLANCCHALKNGNKIIFSGLGKNVPVCEKIVASMISIGLNAVFMDSNTAVHGDLGLIKENDVVILLSKSGLTPESIHLANILIKRKNLILWSITFNEKGLAESFSNNIVLKLSAEGDMWNVLPMNSVVVYLILLHNLIVDIAKELKVSKECFIGNHPGGGIGLLNKK